MAASSETPDEQALTLNRISRPKRLVEIALESMRAAIVDGDWELGQKISESSIANGLGVSKTPVREALVLLKQEGLVEIRPQSGTVVFTLGPGELAHICDLRQALETAAVRLAFQRGHGPLKTDLADIVDSMTKARERGDIREYLRLDGAFHSCLVEHSGNPYLRASYDLIAGKVAAVRTRLGTDPHHLEKSHREHRQVAELIAGDDLEQTLDVLNGHIARKEGSYWEHIQTGT